MEEEDLLAEKVGRRLGCSAPAAPPTPPGVEPMGNRSGLVPVPREETACGFGDPSAAETEEAGVGVVRVELRTEEAPECCCASSCKKASGSFTSHNRYSNLLI